MSIKKESPFDQEIGELKHQMEGLRERLRSLEQSRANYLSPFEVGDLMVNKKGEKAIITSIHHSYDSFSLHGDRLRKDGSQGRNMKIYAWDGWKREKDGVEYDW